MTAHDRHGAKQPERFDPARAAGLDDKARFAYLPPAELFSFLNVPPKGIVLDFGTGTGVYALELAQARPDLTLLALDEQERMLDLLRAKLKTQVAPNIIPLLSSGPETSQWRGKVDRVFALNVLHELGDLALEDLKSFLTPQGQVLFADWNANVERPVGPPKDHVYTPQEGRARLKDFCFALNSERLFPYHYALLCSVQR